MGENRCIEFHDSTLLAIRRDGAVCLVELTVYVHASPGRPGVDAGVGWFQRGELHVTGGVVAEPVELPLRLWGRTISVGGERFDNGAPLPFERSGVVSVELASANGSEVVVSGDGIRVALTGPVGPIEPFP